MWPANARIPLCIVISLFSVGARESQADELSDRQSYVFAGIHHERQKLSSGVFVGKGTRYLSGRDGEYEVPVKVFCAFDFTETLFRFDRDELWTVSTVPKIPLKPGQTVAQPNVTLEFPDRSRQFLHTIVRSYKTSEYVGVFRVGELAMSKVPVERWPAPSCNPFDIRTVGLHNAFSINTDKDLEAMLGPYSSQPASEIVDEGNGILRLDWSLPYNHRRRLWVDQKRGFGITRLEVQRKVREAWLAPSVVNTVTWEQVSDIWVPSSFVFEHRQAAKADGFVPILRYQYDFEWQVVNGAVPPKYFTPAGMDLPKGTIVRNTLGPKTIIEEVVGYPDEPVVTLGEEGEPRDAAPSPLRVGLIVSNVALIVLIAAILGARTYLSRRKAES